MAHGGLPWVGLIKLKLTQPENYAAAPEECRRMLLISLVSVIIGPFVRRRGWEQWGPRRK